MSQYNKEQTKDTNEEKEKIFHKKMDLKDLYRGMEPLHTKERKKEKQTIGPEVLKFKKGVCLVCEENIGKDEKRNECICGAMEYKKTAVNETKVDLYGNVTTNMGTKTETVYKGNLNFEGHVEF